MTNEQAPWSDHDTWLLRQQGQFDGSPQNLLGRRAADEIGRLKEQLAETQAELDHTVASHRKDAHEPSAPQQRSSYWHECEHFKGYTARADFQCPKCTESAAARKCTLCDEPYVMIDDEKTFLCEAHKDCAVRTSGE